MQIDNKAFKEFIAFVIQTFRTVEQELPAHEALVAGLKKHLELGPEIDLLLDQARASEELQEHLRQKYDVPLGKLLGSIEEAEVNQLLIDFLKKWKPDS